MKGVFEPIALERPGLIQRLLGRKLRENAYREVQNLLVTKAVAAIDPDAVISILRDYGVDIADAKPRLGELYTVALRAAARDLDITEQEERDLRRLRDVLGLTHRDVQQIETDMLSGLYRREFGSALADQADDQDERERIEALAKRLRLFG